MRSEREFADYLESQGKTWIHHPKSFRFDGIWYQADFYCPEDDTYYEVKKRLKLSEAEKLLKFKKHYPNLKLKIVSPNGYPYYSPSSGKFLAQIEKKLNVIKSKDILEISLKEYRENIEGFPTQRDGKNNRMRRLRCGEESVKRLIAIRRKVGIK